MTVTRLSPGDMIRFLSKNVILGRRWGAEVRAAGLVDDRPQTLTTGRGAMGAQRLPSSPRFGERSASETRSSGPLEARGGAKVVAVVDRSSDARDRTEYNDGILLRQRELICRGLPDKRLVVLGSAPRGSRSDDSFWAAAAARRSGR